MSTAFRCCSTLVITMIVLQCCKAIPLCVIWLIMTLSLSILFVGLLHKMFSSLYSIEVISESAFLNWKDRGKEKSGRGMALQSSKKFFNWLEHAETESDNDVGS